VVFKHLYNCPRTITFVVYLESDPKSIMGFVKDLANKAIWFFFVFQDVIIIVYWFWSWVGAWDLNGDTFIYLVTSLGACDPSRHLSS